MNTSIPEKLPARYVVIDEARAGQRIDNFLLAILKGIPRTHIYKLLRGGEVRVNKKRIAPAYRLALGDSVRIPPLHAVNAPTPITTVSESLTTLIESRILLETDELLVLNKPSGMAVHGGSGVRYGVIEALRALRPNERSLEVAHRLDRETSGCLLIAKSRAMLVQLHQLLRDNEVKKTYLALVHGRWPRRLNRVDAPLQKNELSSGERFVRVREDGKESLTTFNVRQYYQEATLVEAHPFTGRTHQIRVHAAHAGHPILQDDKYGDASANVKARELGLRRLFLHAARIQFMLPSCDERTVVEAPLDSELQAFLETLSAKKGD